MRLKSAELLRALVGPEDTKKMSARRLASYVGCHPSFINHLMARPAPRRRSCDAKTAERIAEVLGVPLEVLFVPEAPSNSTSVAKRRKVRAA